MSLLNLPVELLEQIIQETMPDEYEPFMLSCKTIYNTGLKLIDRHNTLQRTFSKLDFSSVFNQKADGSMKFLGQVAQEPLIVRYVKSATTSAKGKLVDIVAQDLNELCLLLHEDGQALQRLVSSSSSPDIREIWVSSFSTHPTNSLSRSLGDLIQAHSWRVILISLLENVSTLVLPRKWLNPLAAPASKLLSSIASRASRTRIGPLSRLETLESWCHDDDRIALQDLEAFLVLPKLHHVLCAGYVAAVDEHLNVPFNWRHPDLTSELCKIELAFCCISGTELDKLLPHTPKLQIFKLAYNRTNAHRGWDVNAIVHSLQQHCGKTLTELSLTIDQLSGGTKGGLHAFKSFTVLEDLEIDARFLLGPPVTEELRWMTPVEYRSHSTYTAWNVASVPKLTEMLPPSIESVRLLTGSDPQEVRLLETLFKGWHLKQCPHLPALEKVEVEHGTETVGWVPNVPEDHALNLAKWKPAQEAIEAAGCWYDMHMSVMGKWIEDILYSDRAGA
ncbi:uncharacterized protein LTR77_006091 [Saxophila tyrrhenica]|uniref:F-box domain-containing protein n=1 Tax=Saxophila tyrrhenica TaxID=1690608 RepID=A0AAV9PAV5_9PEZI|nr:hypothetical protein LTR77_006091 [Saxophila tyrrhenica]